MRRYKLANVLLESSSQFFKVPSLYCVSDAPLFEQEDETWLLKGPGTFDFTTFFNALSTSKWLRYTSAKKFWLHLEIKGAACVYRQTRGDSFTWYPELVDGTQKQVDASSTWHTFDIELVVGDDVLVGFMLENSGEVFIKNSYYYTQIEDAQLRDVELALCTTTFKNEDYILPNIDLVKSRIIDADEDISEHFTMHVIDNGRTLDEKNIESARVRVHSNPNAGGAGGFARGMIEALEQSPKATHVLLMDDDVRISPESILRSYYLLRIVSDEYSEAFLSGAMMSMDEPDVRHEDIGYVAREGKYFPVKGYARMGVLHDVITNEAYRLPVGVPGQEDKATQSYAAWWYCVIPTSVIEQNGLPLPIFVRCDDVEYSLRCKAKLMTMNGICVWHSSFNMRYSAAVERYQMPRNVLIARAITGMAPLADFIGDIQRIVELELKKFNYTNAELVLEGIEDYLKGPSFIMEPGKAEERYLAALKHAEKLIPLDELVEVAKEQGIDLEGISSLNIEEDSKGRSLVERAEDLLTVNGQRFMRDGYHEDDYAVIDAVGWAYPAGKMRRKETIIAVDMPNHKGVVRKLDKARFQEIWDRYKHDIRRYKIDNERLEAEYASARATITSVEFWKNYLGIS